VYNSYLLPLSDGSMLAALILAMFILMGNNKNKTKHLHFGHLLKKIDATNLKSNLYSNTSPV
jgi:hypothetical protein